MKTCLIVGAAEIKNYAKLKENLVSDYFVIYCDGGLHHQQELGFPPDLVVGDFDSYNGDRPLCSEIITLPCEKDDTDVFYAVKEALRRGFDDFVLIGVIGQRFDHSLCNISVLLFLEHSGVNGFILDDYSKMRLVGVKNKSAKISKNITYFSLMCIDGPVSGITIKNAKYPLENGTIMTTYQYGISNENLNGKQAVVSVEQGILLLIEIF